MKVTRIASIGLITLAMLVPGAKAQQNKISTTLVQTAKSITASFLGVSADILGIRTGLDRNNLLSLHI